MILVTGGAGFSGARIVARLAGTDDRPRALVRDVAAARRKLPEGVEIVAGDTTKPETLAPALAGIETVIHTAFVTAERKQRPGVRYWDTNVRGTENLVAAAKEAGVRRIVVLSGLGTKAAKAGSYMQGRFLAEESVRQSGLAWSILGPSVQFGPGSAFFKGLVDLIRTAPVVPMIGSGRRHFQPIYVEDVVTCLLKMAREGARYDGQRIEVGGPEVYTYARILDLLMDTMGRHKLKLPGPMPLVAIGAGVMEALLPRPPITTAVLGLFAFENTTALDSVEREFGFQPLSLRAYLAEHGVG
ncbi:MAG TPA: NAD(P)H-binding protein [Ktedonobacterales bacterium]|jgi:NADH dehydrogenase